MTPNNPSTIPVLHVEESIKRYYDVKSKSGNTHRKKYYDVDWRFYIMHKYGRYMVCGTRCPMREYYNEAWPVVSCSFNTVNDVFDYISILLGSNKINMTLFVSTLVAGNDNDATFTQPTNERFRALDAERGDRRGELVGYDRISFDTLSHRRSKLEKTLDIMSTLNSGGVMPFTVSPHPSKRAPVSVPVCPLPTFCAGTDDAMPPLIHINADESEKYEDYGYIFGVNDYDHDAYAEVD